ncbi:MAG: LPP20 family lipoprotein [Sulfurimonas sp.]
MINVRKVFNIAASGVLLVLFGGCASTGTKPQVQSECMQEGVGAPSWVCKPQVMNGYASLGIAENYKANSAQTIQEALKNGRTEIAKQIQSQVKDKINNFSRITAISSKDKVDNLYASIVEEVKPMNITLEKEMKSWISPSGKLYVHVIAPKSTSDEAMKTAVKTSYANDRVTWLSFKSKEALNNLEKEFDVTMPMQQQVTVAEIFRTEKVMQSSVGRNRKN